MAWQAQPTRDNPATLTSPTPCLFWKDPEQVREIWSTVVDHLFLTKNAILGGKKQQRAERGCGVRTCPTTSEGTLRDRAARGLSPEPRAAQTAAPPSFPELQVLGGFSRHKVISCLKRLTNLHRNWRTFCVSGMDAVKSCSGKPAQIHGAKCKQGRKLMVPADGRGAVVTGTSSRSVVTSLLRPTQS